MINYDYRERTIRESLNELQSSRVGIIKTLERLDLLTELLQQELKKINDEYS